MTHHHGNRRLQLRALVVAATVTAALLSGAPIAAAQQSPCDPTQTPAQFRGEVPELAEIVPAPGGEAGEVTTGQAYAYMDAVDAASNRVITGALDQSSWQGRELRWAMVARPSRLDHRSMERIQRAAHRLRDPRTTPKLAREIADRYPAILWVVSNVHGDEESGTEASLRVLYELADRNDCAARQILANALVVLLPIQNPDGREANTRRNAYGFDMNRDWFARTQPETDAKLEMMRRFPGPLFIDAHEEEGTSYFFPPNSDPIYHEITDESIDWINNLYGASMATEFERQGIGFFNRDVYDLFYMGYGDTVPSTGFISAGMTFEKGEDSPITERAYEQYLTQWVSLSQAAIHKEGVLRDWAAAWREAYEQGRRGLLEPNELVNPGDLINQVPEMRVRNYFITESRGTKQAEVSALIRRLQRMDVEVYRLRKRLHVPDFTPYGRSTRNVWLPAGTWYVPMAQMQKHWVQAMLNEDTYTPFPYFYDVTAWSQPLLFNVRGGYSGERLQVEASRVRELEQPSAPPLFDDPPRIALFALSQTSTSTIESAGWLRYLLEQVWKLSYADVSAAEIAAGDLEHYDALLIPNGPAATGASDLGAAGEQALQDWVEGGGHLIAWRGGTELAAQLGLTSALLSDPTSDVPGSLVRVRVDPDSALRRGVGDQAYAFYEYDSVMRASSPDHVAVKFPPAGSADWFISGFAAGAEELAGTAAVVDEPIGAGRTTVFSVEPNFRAFTTGFSKLLSNALLHGSTRLARAQRATTAAIARARRAADRLTGTTATIRLSVRSSSAGRAESVLRAYGARYHVQRSPGRVAFRIANPGELTADQHPFASQLPSALRSAGVSTIALRIP